MDGSLRPPAGARAVSASTTRATLTQTRWPASDASPALFDRRRARARGAPARALNDPDEGRRPKGRSVPKPRGREPAVAMRADQAKQEWIS
jgi:hypothetical protein